MSMIHDITVGSLGLFIQMGPYLVLGMAIAAILSVTLSSSLIVRHIGRASVASVIKASLFGVPLPLCSCSVVPTALYLEDSGAYRPAVTSFLISTPQTGVDSIIASYGALGPMMALFRPLGAWLLGIIGGIVSMLFPEDHIRQQKDQQHEHEVNQESCSRECSCGSSCAHESHDDEAPKEGFRQTIRKAWKYGFLEFIDDTGGHFLLGVLLSGIFAVVLPEGFFSSGVFSSDLLGMFLMVLVGIPIYICSTSSIPIAVMLISKGASIGTAFVFLTAGPATNIATLAILSSRLGKRFTLRYSLTLIFGSVLLGLALDALISWFPVLQEAVVISRISEMGEVATPLSLLTSALLAILILRSLVMKLIRRRPESHSH